MGGAIFQNWPTMTEEEIKGKIAALAEKAAGPKREDVVNAEELEWIQVKELLTCRRISPPDLWWWKNEEHY